METQTTILNLVTAKNQEKTQEKIQKFNVPQQQQYLYRFYYCTR